jgi:hypothetical protein
VTKEIALRRRARRRRGKDRVGWRSTLAAVAHDPTRLPKLSTPWRGGRGPSPPPGLHRVAPARHCTGAPKAATSGLAEVRKVLHMAAVAAIFCRRHGLRAFHQRLTARGKPAKLVVAACMRKLHAILRDRAPSCPASP